MQGWLIAMTYGKAAPFGLDIFRIRDARRLGRLVRGDGHGVRIPEAPGRPTA
jgi:hypothetical protein